MKYKLCEVCTYGKDRIGPKELTPSNYVSTENLLPNLAGLVKSSAMPTSSTVPGFKNGDILVSNIRPYFQKMVLAKETGGCSNDILVLRPNVENISSEFLYYSLAQKDFFNYMTKTGKGTKMPRGDKAAVMKYEIELPDKIIQNRIVKILLSIDNKINSNIRTNDNLRYISYLPAVIR